MSIPMTCFCGELKYHILIIATNAHYLLTCHVFVLNFPDRQQRSVRYNRVVQSVSICCIEFSIIRNQFDLCKLGCTIWGEKSLKIIIGFQIC